MRALRRPAGLLCRLALADATAPACAGVNATVTAVALMPPARTPPPGSQAGRILAAIGLALTSRAEILEDRSLRSLALDVKINTTTKAVRVVLVSPQYEISGETTNSERTH